VKKTWTIIKREYITRVKTKAFVFGTFVAPIFIVALIVLPGILMRVGPEAETSITVADITGRLASRLESDVRNDPKNGKGKALYRISEVKADPADLDSLKRRMNGEILKGKTDVFLILPADIFETNRFEMYAKNVGNFQLNMSLNGMVSSAVTRARLAGSGMDPELVERLSRSVSAKTFKVAEGGAKEESSELAFAASYVMVFMIYIVLLFYGMFVMRGVIEDKSSRVVEVVLSSAKPHEIMAGKVLGIGAAGLTQMTVWALSFLMLSMFGAAFASAARIPLPSVSVWTVLAFVAFFLIGFFLYASLYAALGSLGNSDSDLQNLQWPVMAPLIFSVIVMLAVVKNPNGTLAVVLSLIPFFSPMLMFLRISLHAAPLVQVVVCIALCILTIGGMIWLAGRIFRVGILMYGKRPTLPEVLKWIRYS
jgi:ABC-2 type transport system permease protein